MFKVPRLPHHSSRRSSYTQGWNVISKIQAHKARGALAEAIPDELCEFCGQVLCPEQADIMSPISPSDELARLRRRVEILELVLTCVKEEPGLVSRVPL